MIGANGQRILYKNEQKAQKFINCKWIRIWIAALLYYCRVVETITQLKFNIDETEEQNCYGELHIFHAFQLNFVHFRKTR